MDFSTFRNAVVEAAEKQGIAEYELYYQSSESTGIGAFAHEINEFSSSVDGGVCFRCIVDGRMGYASTERLEPAEAADLVARAASNAASLESDDREFLCEGGKTYEPLERTPAPLPATEELVAAALAGQDALYAADPAVIDGSRSSAECAKTEIAIVNSKGLDLHYENSFAVFMSMAVVSDGHEMANDYTIKSGDFAKIDIKAAAGESVSNAKSKLGADVAPTGTSPVVFSPEAMSSLLGTYSGVFSGENARRGLSLLSGKEGEKIASDIVTLVDDPFYKDSMMPINFDAEGSPTHRKNVIENGKLTTLLHNLKTAAAAGIETTGNASKGSYDSPVGIRPFTMYIAPGTTTEEELLKKADGGVLITSLGGLHAGANVVSGDFSLQSSGYMIEGGKKGKAVKSFTVAGNFYTLLQSIAGVSDTVKLPGFGGMTAFGSPSVLVEGLSIAGK